MPPAAGGARIPWIIKYRPRRIDDVINQDNAKKILVPWFEEWASGKPPAKRAALLYGPPGVGKTSLVEAIANELDFEILELNASDYRSEHDIKRTVGVAATKRPLFKKGIIILLDEIDGIAPREDAGGLKALLDIIPRTRNPIVMTANDPWKDQLRPLRDVSLLVEFRPLGITYITKLLKKICTVEGLECEDQALRYIAEKSMGDVRAAVNDLQAVAEGYGRVTYSIVKAIVRGREKSIDIWRTLNTIFYAKYAWQAKKAVTSSEEDYETLMAWLNDNVNRKYTDPEDLYRAYESLARASVFLSRAKYRGAWSMLSYVFDLIGPGVAMARKSGSISKARYSYPERIKMLAQLRQVRETRDNLARRLSEALRMSKREVINDVFPYLMVIFRDSKDPVVPARIALYYRMTREEVKLLAGARANEILKAAEKLKKAQGREEEEPSRQHATSSTTGKGSAHSKDAGVKAGSGKVKTLDYFFGAGTSRRGTRSRKRGKG